MATTPSKLIDRFGRTVDYVRISVTDRCDFRCLYCMEEDQTFVPRARILTLEELAQVGRAFVELGVRKIRLTGGEPLVRRNVLKLCEDLGRLPGLGELVMTTNGSQLSRYAEQLHAAGVKRLNVSVDSLDEARFQRITRTGKLSQVLEGIEAARRAGFEKIKLNAVILRNRNEDEVVALTRYAAERDMDISFIEEMPLGEVLFDFYSKLKSITTAPRPCTPLTRSAPTWNAPSSWCQPRRPPAARRATSACRPTAPG